MKRKAEKIKKNKTEKKKDEKMMPILKRHNRGCHNWVYTAPLT